MRQSCQHLVTEYISRNRRIGWSTRQMTELVFRHLIDAIGDMDIADMRYADAEDYQSYLADRLGSAASVNSYIKTIRPVFNWAVRRERLQKNPFDNLRLLKEVPNEIRCFTDAEVHAILGSAPERWRARIIAALSAGLRRSEVLNLTVDDVDFEQQIIKVRPKKRTAYTWAWTPKDYEIRYVPLVAELNNLLVSSTIPSMPTGQPYLFLSEKRYRSLQQRIGQIPERVRICPDENFRPFRNLMIRARVQGTFHDFRRTCITKWSRCLPYQEVMRLAGHSDIETTLRYYSAVRTDVVKLAARAYVPVGATGLEPATS